MIEVKAARKFTHGGETYRRGDKLELRDQRHADALVAKGLVNGSPNRSEPKPGVAPPAFTPELLNRNAPEIIAWAGDIGDDDQLQAAISAERDGKARKGVLDALEKALAD